MNLLQRWFNRISPVEPPNSPYRGEVGAAGFHPFLPWLERLASIHDAEDDMIRAGTSPMTYHENDERFIRAMHIWEREYPFINNMEKRQALFIDQGISHIFEAYRYARGETDTDKQILAMRQKLSEIKAAKPTSVPQVPSVAASSDRTGTS